MGLVYNNQVPPFLPQFCLQFLVAAELVEAGDDDVHFLQCVAGARRRNPVFGEQLERQTKGRITLILPLLNQVAGRNLRAAIQVAAQQQFNKEE